MLQVMEETECNCAIRRSRKEKLIERQWMSRQGGWSQIAILAITEWAVEGRSSTKWRPPISPSPTTTSVTTRYRKLFEKKQYRRCSTLLDGAFVHSRECSRSLSMNPIKGMFVGFFCRTTRTSWRTDVDEGTARLVDHEATLGITVIIIFIRIIWWVDSLP